jgi:nucleoside-diphosphate-sugar epimerase
MAMEIAVAGGHGKIALRLLRLLAERGDRARGLIRNPDHAADLEAVGALPVGADLENLDPDAIAESIAGCHVVVFAAGAGPGSGPARKHTMDYGGGAKLIEAAKLNSISRYLMVSAMGVRDPAARGEQMQPYYEAKLKADQELVASGLDYTIVRPGRLTDDAGTGLIAAAEQLERMGEVPRDDVAATLLACIDNDHTIGYSFDLLGGETPIDEALAAL